MNKEYNIFLVEDDELYAELLTAKITDIISAKVSRFATGIEMLNAIRLSDTEPDIILLDYYLESSDDLSMSGLDVYRNLPGNLSKVPVILISGSTDYSLVGAALKMGVYDFIHKNENTFDRLENVLKKVEETLDLKSELSTINRKSLKVQRTAGVAVLTIVAIVSILSYKF